MAFQLMVKWQLFRVLNMWYPPSPRRQHASDRSQLLMPQPHSCHRTDVMSLVGSLELGDPPYRPTHTHSIDDVQLRNMSNRPPNHPEHDY